MEQFDDQEILFEMPVALELTKSGDEEPKRCVKGFGSTASEDKDLEKTIMHGMDYQPLKDDGFINYDHQRKILANGVRVPMIIGFPTDVVMKSEGLWIEGQLLSGDPMLSEQMRLANEMWELGIALKKAGGGRSLAYSIEGKVLEQRGNKLVKTVANAVALTHKPVNSDCTVEVFMKSKLCCGKCSPDHPDYNPAHKCHSNNKQIQFTDGIPHLVSAMEKALATDNSGPITTVRTSPLIRENIDRGLTSVLYGDVDCDKHYDRATGRFFKGVSGAVEHMTDCLGYSRDESTRLLKRLLNGTYKSAELLALVQTAGFIRQ